jgi:hypothetical protein
MMVLESILISYLCSDAVHVGIGLIFYLCSDAVHVGIGVYVDVLAVTPYMLVVGGDLDVLSDTVHVGSGIWREGGREE